MKRFRLLVGAASAMVLGFGGCAGDTDGDAPPLNNVESIEAYRYEGVPAAAEKKIVTDTNEIKDVYEQLFSGSAPKNGEPLMGGEVISFRVNLEDGTKYETVYYESSSGDVEKAREIWESISGGAAAAEMDELPGFSEDTGVGAD